MKREQRGQPYLLLDSRSAPLARALLESPADAPRWQIQVLDGKVEAVLEHEVVQIVGFSSDVPALLGRIIQRRGDRIVLEKLRALGDDVRQNLRMPVRFSSFIYPLTGRWTGRREVVSHDLSCGGISFFCREQLEERERLEIVIPITAEPLLLSCEVIRERPSSRGTPLYAAKFVDLCDEEEAMVREAVFDVQLQNRPRPAAGD